jgi:2-polyprenyl-3-methyl-5-hydroxy-6-metoxy-1,4-benzoquinol methylase
MESAMTGRIQTSDAGEWLIAGVNPDVAATFLKKYAPWRMELSFDGVSSSQFGTFEPYNQHPLRKLKEVLKFVPEAGLKDGRVLDIGFNAGYNSLYVAQRCGATVTGVDIAEKHKKTADELANMLGVNAEFLLESAEVFERPNTFDLVLHFGTLYHLANPVSSIDKCVRSLKRSGWFALETMCYRGEDDPTACKWIYGLNGDRTNFWSLGEEAIRSMVFRSGIKQFEIILEVWPAAYERKHSRTIWVGKREK